MQWGARTALTRSARQRCTTLRARRGVRDLTCPRLAPTSESLSSQAASTLLGALRVSAARFVGSAIEVEITDLLLTRV